MLLLDDIFYQISLTMFKSTYYFRQHIEEIKDIVLRYQNVNQNMKFLSSSAYN